MAMLFSPTIWGPAVREVTSSEVQDLKVHQHPPKKTCFSLDIAWLVIWHCYTLGILGHFCSYGIDGPFWRSSMLFLLKTTFWFHQWIFFWAWADKETRSCVKKVHPTLRYPQFQRTLSHFPGEGSNFVENVGVLRHSHMIESLGDRYRVYDRYHIGTLERYIPYHWFDAMFVVWWFVPLYFTTHWW